MYQDARKLTTKKLMSLNDALVKFLVCINQPISLVASQHFLAFVKALNSQYKLPCSLKVRENLIPDLAHNCKCNLLRLLMNEVELKCSLSTDIWTSNSQCSYLGITCHFIDRSWKFNSVVISLSYLNEPKTSDYLSRRIQEQLKEWKLESKVGAFVSDSGANIYEALSTFDNTYVIACAAHRLNLCISAIFVERKIKIKEQLATNEEHQDELTN